MKYSIGKCRIKLWRRILLNHSEIVLLNDFVRIIYLILLLVLIHFVLQWYFFWWNRSLFDSTSVRKEIWSIFWYEFRIDIAAVVALNLPPIFFLIIGSYFNKSEKWFINIAFVVALLLNIAGIALNIFDTGYFRFSKERATIGLLAVIRDSLNFVPSIVREYFLLILLQLILGIFVFKIIRYSFSRINLKNRINKSYLILGHITLILLLFILIRGVDESPLIPVTPLLSVQPENLSITQNSVHTFMYSALRSQQQLSYKKYFSSEKCNEIVTTGRKANWTPDSMFKRNILVFILESFSAEYLKDGSKYRATTPFFDSLLQKCLYFPNAHANAFSSNQGIVAILGGLPNFMDEPFYYSTYANTKMTGVGNIFKDNGYVTNFFMGAGKDHFGFGKFCGMLGIEHYYSRKDFDKDDEFDGNWGIYDEPFLQFGLKKLNQMSKPFFSVFFTISSHPPFSIPQNLKERFEFPGQTASMKSIAYVDFAFQSFFDSARKENWFNNTLFLFCADHWLAQDNETWSLTKSSAIPIFIFDPMKPYGSIDSSIAGQIDVMPTLYDLIKYRGSYTSMGSSLLDSSAHTRYVVNRLNGIYQIITNEWILGYNDQTEITQYFYQYKKDAGMKNNLVSQNKYAKQRIALERIIKANIQQYNNSLMNRNLIQN